MMKTFAKFAAAIVMTASMAGCANDGTAPDEGSVRPVDRSDRGSQMPTNGPNSNGGYGNGTPGAGNGTTGSGPTK